MFQTAVLASGSKGNCILIKTESTTLLIDAGLSARKIFNCIRSLNLCESKINAVIVSHEHSDHVQGAGIVCRRLKIPLFITRNTYEVSRHKIGHLPSGLVFFENDTRFKIGNIIISPLASSHDAIDSCNFTVKKEFYSDSKLSIATDLGFCSKLHINEFKNSTCLVLESNHDSKMLINGSYPWELKQRIKSNHGHLSNEQAVGLLNQIIQTNLKNIILAHISEENNCYIKVKNIFEEYLAQIRLEANLYISRQNEPTPLVDI